MVLHNLGHAILAKAQSAFCVEEASVEPCFEVESPFLHSSPGVFLLCGSDM